MFENTAQKYQKVPNFGRKKHNNIDEVNFMDNYLYRDKETFKVNMPTEAATEEVLWKKVFLEISQNSRENTCARDSFLIKCLWHRCFPVNFSQFLRAPFLKEHLRWLLLCQVKRVNEDDFLCSLKKSTTSPPISICL